MKSLVPCRTGKTGRSDPISQKTIGNAKVGKKRLKKKNDSKRRFSEYLGTALEGGAPYADEDLILERRLAKKLNIKRGRLTSKKDDLDVLLDGIPSVFDYPEETEDDPDYDDSFRSKKQKTANEDLSDDDDDDEDGDDDEDEDEDGDDDDVVEEELLEMGSNKGRMKKMKYRKDLESVTAGGNSSSKADFAMQTKLAKKPKAKAGKVGRDNDDNNMLLEGTHSVLDSNIRPSESGETSIVGMASEKSGQMVGKKYVAPHLRSQEGNESEEHKQVRRRVRGLLNRLSETNVESITREIFTLFQSVSRSVGSQIVSEEVVASCSRGPRGSEQYAAVFAAFVAGMACLVGVDFGARLLARHAKTFEDEYLKEDNLSLRNLTLLLSYIYIFGVCSSELMYDFLIMLGKQLTEVDVSTILTVLNCCGMKLRGEDPLGMKNFILSVQSRVNELKSVTGSMQSSTTSRRMDFMLETIFDIKNNKKKPKEDTLPHTRIKKWLQTLKVDDILIRGLKWSKLLDPDKKGQWWLSGDMVSTKESLEDVAGTIDKEIPETKKMLELAAAQRMNTDARRAIFCVIMSGEDYVDAFEKLLRLDLQGKQDREIMRVLVECCLQEKIFNKYYSVLATKLCSHDKNHKFTLQYCLWDHFKELDSMTLVRSMHLAKFTAEMIASFSLSLAALKTVELHDIMHLSPKKIMHFRMLFEAIFEFPDKLVWNIFTRIAAAPEYEPLRDGIEFFIKKYVVSNQNSLADKFKIAKKALKNIEGVVM